MTAFLLVALALQGAHGSQASIEGYWRSPGGNSIMKIRPCGGSPCGTVAWASNKAKNDARKTTDQLVGSQLLTDLQQRQDGSWLGKLFIPDKNMRVTAKIQLVGDQQLRVSGCLAGKALCHSDLWTRTAEPSPTTN